jgi:dihydropteroate synthase
MLKKGNRFIRTQVVLKTKSLQIGNHIFDWGSRTYVMGILNITPDSFSGDGILAKGDSVRAALDQARQFLADGADILDVGGESTRPGSQPVGADEEIERVIPVIEAVAREFPDALVSIDTYKARVAEAAFRAGAQLLNDVWALRADPDLASVAAANGAPVILMHNRSSPASVEVREQLGNAYFGSAYDDLMEDIQRELLASVDLAVRAGVQETRILLDPGIGFGKTREHNLELIDRLGEIRSLGYPVLLGPSRKSFIGFTLDLPPDQRVEGTAATVAIGIARGADIIRVHDVREMARVAKMTDAIVRRK